MRQSGGGGREARAQRSHQALVLFFDQIALARQPLHDARDDLLNYNCSLVGARTSWNTGTPALRWSRVCRPYCCRIVALGQERASFPVLAHTLPPSAGIDGLLGLDYLRGQTLTVDFRSGTITLS
jgi:hypothetical protein